ncbi:RluA family pseudouridine synthase [Bdellovibrio sp. NC01]|uniref:RluA family pseudouridine synthase n=1 Tax=Bdellovibrio sp. NC01 TaxID=2220073 RepID=UPI00115BCDE6|nr:RNA pseudouridine synthase [Bdellovibrio sp. NC01]QDK37289.1 RNA pseudouridine synthase [Bdellovibrio sp. NC01]
MINVVFQNEHFVICDKPSGVLSTPSRFEDEDTRACLGKTLQHELGIQIFPVHRLDFEVSGLVMYAKSMESHRAANAWFENRTVTKTYCALTSGQDFSHIPDNVQNTKHAIELKVGHKYTWTAKVLRGKRRAYESPQGKPSLTEAIYLGVNSNGFHLWDLHPVTGRSHQLRFDLSRHGFPIIGDILYGSKERWLADDAIALRSYEIDFSRAKQREKFSLPQKISIHKFI